MIITPRRALAQAALWLALAAGTAAAARPLFGTPALMINVSWDPAVTQGSREYLERRLRLAFGEHLHDTVWVYALLDPSADGIRAIVTHPQVRDTHRVDRAAFIPSAGAEWIMLNGLIQSHARLLRSLALGTAAVFGGFALLAAALVLRSHRDAADIVEPDSRLARLVLDPAGVISPWWKAISRFLQRGVPPVSAEAAGLFRILFGTFVLAFPLLDPARSEYLADIEASPGHGPYSAAVWLAHHPDIVNALDTWLLWSGLLFVAGFATHASFAAFTLGFAAWATVMTANGANHATSALVLTVLALVFSRWGDAISLDASIRRWRGRESRRAAGRLYGYSVWLPGFVLSIALAAAAWSKLREGLGWILNGTVKYHFLTDAHQAWVDWGVRATQSDTVAVAASAAAVVTEALLFTAPFTRSYRYRVALGCAVLLLFAGFVLFQGVFWPGWWILLASFLPWHRVGAHERLSQEEGPSASTWQLAAMAILLVQQVIVSVNRLERPPLLSSYDMYATTYTDMEDYRRHINPP